jgi:HK97 family phage portal protein
MWPLKKKSIKIQELAEIVFGSWGRVSSSGVNVSPNAAMHYDTVYSCVRILTDSIASLPLIVYQKKGEQRERAVNLPIYQLLHDAPNDWQTAIDWRSLMVTHLCLWGNSYSHIVRNLKGEPIQLQPILPTRVEVKQATDWTVTYSVSQETGEKKTYPASEILHVRNMSMGGLVGVAPIDMLKDAIGLGIAAEAYQAKFFQNLAKPSGVLKLPKSLATPEAIKRFKAKMKEAISGESQNDFLVLDEGAEWQQISLSSEDSELTLTRKYQKAAIAGAYGVPLYKLNEMDGAKFRNVEQQALEFVKWSLLPYFERIEQAMFRKLLTKEQQKVCYFEHLIENALRGDIKTRYESYQLAIMNGIMNPDDARRMENLPPRKDNMGNQYFYSANYLPAGTTQDTAIEKRKEAINAIS